MSGYARAHRGRWEHPLFKSKQEAAVWAWMCDTARWRAHTFQTRFGVVTLERGQILVSERTVAEDFGLGRQQVRRLMDSLEITSMIARNSTHKASRAGTIVTIVNYEKYQSDNDDTADVATQGQPKRQPKTNPRPTQDQPTREEREKREYREEEEDSRPSDSSAGEPADAQLLPTVRPPAIDHVGQAFAAHDALRREMVPGARPVKLQPDRRKKLAARLSEIGGPEGWEEVLAQIRASPFLCGENRSGKFIPDIDWLIEPKNLRKVMEGNFDGRNSNIPGKPPHVRGSPIDALSVALAATGLGR